MAAAPRRITSLRDDDIFGFLDVDGQPNYLYRSLALIGTYVMRCVHMPISAQYRIDDLSSIREEADLIIEEIQDAPPFDEKANIIEYVGGLREYFFNSYHVGALRGIAAIDLSFPYLRLSTRTFHAFSEDTSSIADRILDESIFEGRIPDESIFPDRETHPRLVKEFWERYTRICLINNVRVILAIDGRIHVTDLSPEYLDREIRRVEKMAIKPPPVVLYAERLRHMADLMKQKPTFYPFRPSFIEPIEIEPGREINRYVFWRY